MRGRRLYALLSLAVPVTVLCVVACSSGPEQAILKQFFTASRLRDNTTLAGFSAAAFEPNVHGIVTAFEITAISPERRTPLGLRTLARAHEDARAEDAEFSKRKDAYQKDNIEAIARVLKAERARSKISRSDAEVQATWTRLRDESAQISKRVSDARRKLTSETGIIEMSVADPRKKVDITQYDGELVTKEVTIAAPVKTPDGATADRTLVVTMQRAVLKGESEITGKWIITGVRDATASPATKTS
jgi:hypothetical protein